MPNDIVLSPPTELASPTLTAGCRSGPAILQRRDEDFIAAVLEALGDDAGRDGLSASLAKARDKTGVLKLFQPVQREYHLAIVEVHCDQPGRPRLDPARVAAAGLVVRRLGKDSVYEGWMRAGGQLQGWLSADRLGGTEVDPASRMRRARQLTGVADLDRELAARRPKLESGWMEEDVAPMFPAPPRICQAAKKTFYYGVIPTTSRETSVSPTSLASALGADARAFGSASQAFRDHLHKGLQGKEMKLPLAGRILQAGWYDAVTMPSAGKPRDLSDADWNALQEPESDAAAAMREFIAFLEQLAFEFDVFSEKPASKAICDLLHEIQMPLPEVWMLDPQTHPSKFLQDFVRADDFLRQAATLLLGRQPADAAPKMPERWPALDEDTKNRLLNALSQALQTRFSEVSVAQGRYDEPNAQYAIRAFVREKPDGACPGRIHWSGYSEPFVIAPWYEGDGAPPIQVTLPDLSKLSALTPNVSFVVPSVLRGLMSGSPKDMLEGTFNIDENAINGSSGDGSNGGDGAIAWICSFNIPVITFCAFLVLNLFLKLFSLIIRLALSVSISLKFPGMAIKLCLPFPKKGV